MTKLCAVAGPTASGKTALAVELGLRLGGEVVSFDSMQVYRGLSIGTAKPDASEMKEVPHHLFDILNPGEDFSCSDFCEAARPVIQDISRRGKLPILCGGTGLYMDSLLAGPGLSSAGADEELRRKYAELAKSEGPEALHAILYGIDPESAAAIHPNNVKRVIRAIEIFELTGSVKSEWDRRSKELPAEYDAAVLILSFRNRELLYDRIERRVDAMLDAGLEAEAESLYAAGLLEGGKGISQAIGYKEFLPYFKGVKTLAEVREDIILATRHYAKRQITWFSRRRDGIEIFVDDGEKIRPSSELADEAVALVRGKGKTVAF